MMLKHQDEEYEEGNELDYRNREFQCGAAEAGGEVEDPGGRMRQPWKDKAKKVGPALDVGQRKR
jgi:hypothetical protein